ncbi:MAG: hypothetical protein Q8R79_02455 [Legionellaceae bacterium]|nr:hypothetical protein [Legionellaceae bacterium]
MSFEIALSKKAQALIEKAPHLKPKNTGTSPVTSILSDDFSAWLSPPAQTKPLNAEHIQFVTLLLEDTLHTLHSPKNKSTLPPQKRLWQKVIFIVLGITGAIYALFEGLGGMAAFLSAIFSVSPIIIGFTIGFALLSLLAFFAFEMRLVANNLGLSYAGGPDIIKNCLEQVDLLNKITNSLSKKLTKKNQELYASENISAAQLESYRKLLAQLDAHRKTLHEQAEMMQAALNSWKMKSLQWGIAGLIGIIYFSAGYLTGEAVVFDFLIAVCLLSIPSWIGILLGVIGGISLLCMYIFLQKPEVDSLVAQLSKGLDMEKVEVLAEKTKEDDNLQCQMETCMALIDKLSEKTLAANAKNMFQATFNSASSPAPTEPSPSASLFPTPSPTKTFCTQETQTYEPSQTKK